MIKIIEQNVFGHFKYLPEVSGFHVKTDQNLTIIRCMMGSSMFNIVCGVCPLEQIEKIIHEFDGQPFAWWIGPSIRSTSFSQALINHGFVVETSEHAMLCELTHTISYTPNLLSITQVDNTQQLEDFIEVLEPYDASARKFYENLEISMLQKQERLFVGYADNRPAIIGLLFFLENSAGIFSLLTREDQRGRGFGTQMMTYLMKTAQNEGAKYITLSASSDSGYRIYERLGFKDFGQFECFEWKPL